MDEIIIGIFKVQSGLALEVWFSIYIINDWGESLLLIGSIRHHRSLWLPENWSKLANKLILHVN